MSNRQQRKREKIARRMCKLQGLPFLGISPNGVIKTRWGDDSGSFGVVVIDAPPRKVLMGVNVTPKLRVLDPHHADLDPSDDGSVGYSTLVATGRGLEHHIYAPPGPPADWQEQIRNLPGFPRQTLVETPTPATGMEVMARYYNERERIFIGLDLASAPDVTGIALSCSTCGAVFPAASEDVALCKPCLDRAREAEGLVPITRRLDEIPPIKD